MKLSLSCPLHCHWSCPSSLFPVLILVPVPLSLIPCPCVSYPLSLFPIPYPCPLFLSLIPVPYPLPFPLSLCPLSCPLSLSLSLFLVPIPVPCPLSLSQFKPVCFSIPFGLAVQAHTEQLAVLAGLCSLGEWSRLAFQGCAAHQAAAIWAWAGRAPEGIGDEWGSWAH